MSGRAERVAIGVLLIGFGFGAVTHAIDYARLGWFPYRFGPPAANLLWNALVVLDAAVVLLLVTGRRRAGLILALAVMAGDLTANAYGLFVLGIPAFAVSLPIQAAFAGFLLGATGFLWRARAAVPVPALVHRPTARRDQA